MTSTSTTPLLPWEEPDPELLPGWRLIRVPEVGSTSDLARAEADNGAEHGTVIWARRQVGGRGRMGKAWESPIGNLYCSVVLRPDCEMNEAAQISFVAALAVADTLGGFLPTGIERKLKWPNDVLVDGKKICGILLESNGRPAKEGSSRLDWLVLGIGINIASYPAVTPYPTTAMKVAGADRTLTPGKVLTVLLRHLHLWLKRWQKEGFAPVRVAWLTRAHRPGDMVKVKLGMDLLEGRFSGIDDKGALVITLADGTEQRVMAGEVFF